MSGAKKTFLEKIAYDPDNPTWVHRHPWLIAYCPFIVFFSYTVGLYILTFFPETLNQWLVSTEFLTQEIVTIFPVIEDFKEKLISNGYAHRIFIITHLYAFLYAGLMAMFSYNFMFYSYLFMSKGHVIYGSKSKLKAIVFSESGIKKQKREMLMLIIFFLFCLFLVADINSIDFENTSVYDNNIHQNNWEILLQSFIVIGSGWLISLLLYFYFSMRSPEELKTYFKKRKFI